MPTIAGTIIPGYEMSNACMRYAPAKTPSAIQYREERLRDPRILAFIPRVMACIDDEIEAKGPPLRHAARLKRVTTDGRTFERMLPDRRGSPENPLKPEDLEYKFRHVTASCVPAKAIDRLVELADRFESLAAAPLMEAGRRAGQTFSVVLLSLLLAAGPV